VDDSHPRRGEQEHSPESEALNDLIAQHRVMTRTKHFRNLAARIREQSAYARRPQTAAGLNKLADEFDERACDLETILKP